MPQPSLYVYIWLNVTLTFDLLTLKVDRFMPLHHGPLVPVGIVNGSFIHASLA